MTRPWSRKHKSMRLLRTSGHDFWPNGTAACRTFRVPTFVRLLGGYTHLFSVSFDWKSTRLCPKKYPTFVQFLWPKSCSGIMRGDTDQPVLSSRSNSLSSTILGARRREKSGYFLCPIGTFPVKSEYKIHWEDEMGIPTHESDNSGSSAKALLAAVERLLRTM